MDDKQLAKLHTKVLGCRDRKILQTKRDLREFVGELISFLVMNSCFSGQPEALHGTCASEECGEGFQVAGEGTGPQLPRL